MSLAYCPYCHLNYDESSGIDRNIHARRHKKWQQVEQTLHYLPRPYAQREEMKIQAYKLIHEGKTQKEKIQGCMLLFRAHFDRSLCAAIHNNYWKKHPSFEQYVTMMDYHESVVPEDIMKKIRKKYPHKQGYIAPYYSYWLCPDTTGRNQQSFQAEKRKRKKTVTS